MSPEQAQNAKDVDGRADIFALGCVLYECVRGQVAYEGNHPVAILAKLLVEEPPKVREVREDAPEAVDALVGRMMAKERATGCRASTPPCPTISRPATSPASAPTAAPRSSPASGLAAGEFSPSWAGL
jgi:eukaryotic-like serine/threonine-protein kinase